MRENIDKYEEIIPLCILFFFFDNTLKINVLPFPQFLILKVVMAIYSMYSCDTIQASNPTSHHMIDEG